MARARACLKTTSSTGLYSSSTLYYIQRLSTAYIGFWLFHDNSTWLPSSELYAFIRRIPAPGKVNRKLETRREKTASKTRMGASENRGIVRVHSLGLASARQLCPGALMTRYY